MDLNEFLHCGTRLQTKQTKSQAKGRRPQLEENDALHSDIVGPIQPQRVGE